MLSLRAEIAACLFAVSLLGLIAGWMMQRARAARRLRRAVTVLEERHAEAERSARLDIENLEERLQTLGEELRTLTAENRTLRENSRGEEDARDGDAARAESIEQNRRQVDAQERLQRIIREREREIATLRAGIAGHEPAATVLTAPVADPDAIVAEGLDETVRLDPALLPARVADARASDVRSIFPVPASVSANASSSDSPDVAAGGTPDGDSSLDDTLESTVDVTFLDAEEATVALDEETLSLVRGLGRGERKGGA